jgi:hypothetical protein
MVGDYPKSDINPALEAGLNAVLVPPIPGSEHGICGRLRGGRLLRVDKFLIYGLILNHASQVR